MAPQVAKEPVFSRGHPVVSTAATTELLKSTYLSSEPVDIAKRAIELQLVSSEKAVAETKDKNIDLKIFEVDFAKLEYQGQLGQNVDTDIETLSSSVTEENRQKLFTWEKLPYVLRCAGLQSVSLPKGKKGTKKKAKVGGEPELVDEVDEWVLKNEMFLRFLSRKSGLESVVSDWSYGLLRIQDLATVFNNSSLLSKADNSPIALKLTRVKASSLPGFTVLDAKQRPAIYLQPSIEAFKSRWASLTGNVLQGLNWSNIFIAGGTALGSLLTPEIPATLDNSAGVNKEAEWLSSDIDMYVYGLGPEQANEKVKHIAEVYKKNLPKDAPFLVVRNSQTITLYSKYPTKQVQIVMKLVGSPREVLLNFDLDICAVGFDGEELWMLPRCARALETATNVFTMDLINGHYLGDRKATRDQRVFKYANKGYGIRILPSYTAHLSTYRNASQTSVIARGETLLKAPYSLETLAGLARNWTAGCMDKYISLNYKNSPFHWPKRHPRIENEKKPVFSHAMLESYTQVTSEPLGSSCLTGFSLFMRHVALWEAESKGEIVIFDELWASNTYGEGLANLAYDDSPAYTWDASFDVDEFKHAIDSFNMKESVAFVENSERTATYEDRGLDRSDIAKIARVTYGDSVDDILSAHKDIVIALVIDRDLMDYANELLLAGLKESGFPQASAPLIALSDEEKKIPVLWRLDRILNWQMMSRRIDEVREVLWSFHRANERISMVEEEARTAMLTTQISKRAIRTTVADELDAFVRWVGRKPYHEGTTLQAHYCLGWEGDDDEE
ncbi:hypothetical protein C8J56DRAFT_364210 [Mycena floridula]|nr:hypothetical protein C8J56DRAFT_364210 [Mycena floridula]